MNLFLLFAFLIQFYPRLNCELTTHNSSKNTHKHNELRIEDIQTLTTMKNGIVITPITYLNEDIISLERSVIRFLINHHYIIDEFIYQWERLKRRHVLTESDQSKMMINEATIYKAIKTYQKDNRLTQTGIMDMNILKKVFGNKYDGISMIDAGGVYFLDNIKTYGEDDPTIDKPLKFQTLPQRKKRSLYEKNTINKKKSSDL